MKGLFKIIVIVLSLYIIPAIETQSSNYPTTFMNTNYQNELLDTLLDGQPFTGAAIENNILIASTNDRLIRFNLNVPINKNNMYTLFQGAPVDFYDDELPPDLYNGGSYRGDSKHLMVKFRSNAEYLFNVENSLVIVRNGIALIVGRRNNDYYLSRHDITSFRRLDTSAPNINPLKGSFKVLEDDEYFYFIARSGSGSKIIKIEKEELLNPNDIIEIDIVNSKSYDSESFHDAFLHNDRIYFTSESKKIGLIDTTNLDIIGTSVTTETFKSIIYDSDPVRGDRIFIATEGSVNEPTKIVSFDPNTFTQVEEFNFRSGQYGITSSVYEPGGIWYFSTTGHQIGLKRAGILQFDVARQEPEGLSDLNTPVYGEHIIYDKSSRRLYIFGKASGLSSKPVISLYQASDLCLEDCFGNGDCVRRRCQCHEGQDGDFKFIWHEETWCYTRDCSNLTDNGEECNGEEHGTCLKDNKGTCLCEDDWTGPACETRRCPRDCSNRGKCDVENDYTCMCNPGWEGRACEISTKLPCHMLKDCDECVDNPNCIWCASSSLCYNGTNIGPDSDDVECRYWYYSQCPSVAFDIVNYIFTAIVALVIILNVVGIAIFDLKDESSNTRERWYILQRANKGWTMIRQLQLICISGLIAYNIPTNFLVFPRYWNWIMLSFGYPWNTVEPGVDNPVKSTRNLASVEQFQTYWKTNDDEIFFAFLIWFAVVIGISLILMLVTIILAIVRKVNVGYILKTRLVYMLIRVLEFGHLGICVLGPIALIKGGKSAAVGGIVWIVIGILVPAAIYVKIAFFTTKKDLFRPPTVDRFSSFYGLFNLKDDIAIKLTILPYAYRFIVGLFIGFLATTSVPGQLVPLLIIHLAQVIFYIYYKDLFSDYLQRYLEIFLAIINLISFSVLLGYSKSASKTTSSVISIMFLVLQFLGVTVCGAFLIISWLQKQEIYTLKQCWNCCSCRKK